MTGSIIDNARRAIRWVDSQRTRIGRTRQGGGPNRPAQGLAVTSTDAALCPEGGWAWLYSWVDTDRVYQVKRAEYPGITRVGVASGEIPAGGTGRVRTAGVMRALVSGYASVSVGDRVGVVADSWYAAAHPFGQALVVGQVPAAEQPSGLPAGVGLMVVRLDPERIY